MKRVGFLFDKAFSKENLLEAFETASKNKRDKWETQEFKKHLAFNIDSLFDSLHNGTYHPDDYRRITVYEPKERLIYAPTFRDQVVQHAIYKIIYPIFNKTFIETNFACRKGKGTHKAADYSQKALQRSLDSSYTLKLDIRKFFFRIDRDILKSLLERRVKDQRFLKVILLFTVDPDPKGIPIGNLLSQLFALIYLNPLDQFIKRILKVKFYCRYVDDFILFNLAKSQSLMFLSKIIIFLKENLNLELSKFSIEPKKKGINFVGFRTWSRKRFIRKRSLYNFSKRCLQDKLISIISILGHTKQTHSLKHLINFLKVNYHGLYRQLPKIYHSRDYQRSNLSYR